VFGVRHRNDGAAVADTAGPLSDVGDIGVYLDRHFVEVREQMANIVVDNILALLAGKPPPNCVNPQVFSP